jgi:hypothetical protein
MRRARIVPALLTREESYWPAIGTELIIPPGTEGAGAAGWFDIGAAIGAPGGGNMPGSADMPDEGNIPGKADVPAGADMPEGAKVPGEGV